MKSLLYLVFYITAFLMVRSIPACADQVSVIRFRAPSIYAQNYAAGFDRGYASAWNAYRTGDALDRWVRDWSSWVITNPAYVRGYEEGVRQALHDAEYVEKETVSFSNFRK
jgi:hypothetical protein